MKTQGFRSAIVVPGCSDLNKGDQALIWETISLLEDTGCVDRIMLLDAGDPSQKNKCQTIPLGYNLLPSILRHPRRGKHRPEDKVKEGGKSMLAMLFNAAYDLVWSGLLLAVAPHPRLAKLLLSKPQLETYFAFRDTSVVTIKGGGMLHAYGGVTAFYYVWYQLFYVKLAQRLNKPVVVLPNSFGPFNGLGVAGQVRRTLARCASVMARESTSSEALSRLMKTDVSVMPDLGFYLRPAGRRQGEEICRASGVPIGEKKLVAFTVRPYRFPGSTNPGEKYRNYLQSLASLVEHVASKGYHPVFVTQVLGPSSHENDRLAIIELQQLISGVEHSWIDGEADCRTLKSVYGCMDFVVGTRFHSVVFAESLEIPSMAIAYGGNKALGIMKDQGLGEYVTKIEDVSSEVLCDMFDQLVLNADQVRVKLRAWNQHAREQRNVTLRTTGSIICGQDTKEMNREMHLEKRLLIAATVPGTIRSFLLPFAEHFRELGWRVDCMASSASESPECDTAFDNVYNIDWSRNPLDPRNLLRACKRVREVVKDGNYDVVHVHTPVAAFVTRFALRKLRQQLGLKVAYTAHGFHFHPEGKKLKNAAFVVLEKLAGRWTDQLVVINQEDYSAADRHEIVTEGSLYYMPGIGIDTTKYSPSTVSAEEVARIKRDIGLADGQQIFLMVAEFIPRKRHIDVIHALSKLNDQNAVLVFAGEGPLLTAMKTLADDLGLREKVRFLGRRPDIPVLMAASYATLLPSIQEGLPRSVMESLSMSIPVIGARVRGVTELLCGDCGILHGPRNVDEIADAMIWMLSHPTDVKEMGRNGRQKMTGDYELQNIIKQHQALYSEHLAEDDMAIAA